MECLLAVDSFWVLSLSSTGSVMEDIVAGRWRGQGHLRVEANVFTINQNNLRWKFETKSFDLLFIFLSYLYTFSWFSSSLTLRGCLIFSLVTNNIFLSKVTQYRWKASHSLNEMNLSVSVFWVGFFCLSFASYSS